MTKETKPFTDNVFQPIKLYIEGVQVPFSAISITSGIGGLPTASVTIPPQAALMDIARFYNPKVHIFYTDLINDYDDPKDADKLLFSGVIAQVNYSKVKDVASSLSITFTCVHRYNFLNDMPIDYTGWLNADPINPSQAEGVKPDTANSMATVIEALSGVQNPNYEVGNEVTKDTPDGKTSIIPERYKKFYNRILGMPGVLINFWNQMKRSAFNRELRQGNLFYSEAFVRMWQPLIEDGLQFFDRMGGHYPIEAMVQADDHRVDPCPDTPGKKDKIVIPPARQLFLSSSVQAEMTISNIASYLQNSGEVTTIYQIFNNFYESIDYQIVTLASPAEIPVRPDTPLTEEDAKEFTEVSGNKASSETHALDTLVVPKLPFYFSPTCNVLFPGMYSRLSVSYDEINMPTRITLKNIEGVDDKGYKTNFRAPHSIREAIAKKVAGVNGVGAYVKDNVPYSLKATMGASYGAIGLYEQGRGLKQEIMHLPRWLSHFSNSTMGTNEALKDASPDKNKEAAKYEALNQLAKGWESRYPGNQVKTLNPYAPQDTDISAHHRMLFSAADYYYTQRFAASKIGTVTCPFNPHIVPGYPMDILESNPAYPSFHAMCAQVTHYFTDSSAETSVSFVGAMTYAELANYHIPFVSPMLQVALGLAEKPTLVEPDEKAVNTANEFYRYTLGVPAVTPQDLIDFSTMLVKPKKWGTDKWTDGSGASITDQTNGGERNPMLSYYGNLSLTYRAIESKADIEDRFDNVFIDMEGSNYTPTMIKYRDQQLDNQTRYEIGRSQFLTYDTFFGEEVKKEDVVLKTEKGITTVTNTGAQQ